MRDFRDLAATDAVGQHVLTDSASEADCVLYVGCHLVRNDPDLNCVSRHPLRRRYPQKFLVHDERDRPWPRYRGLYTSLPRHSFGSGTRAVLYANVAAKRARREPDLLFTFRGSRTHPSRDRLAELDEARGNIDFVSSYAWWDSQDPRYEANATAFEASLNRGKFILCPRGEGTASIRLVQALGAGRVPVIISDQWVPPAWLDWPTCSVRISEAHIGNIPQILREREPEWKELSLAARAAYESSLSNAHSFNTLMTMAAELIFTGERLEARRFNQARLEAYHRFGQQKVHGARHRLGGWSGRHS